MGDKDSKVCTISLLSSKVSGIICVSMCVSELLVIEPEMVGWHH